MAYRTCFLMLLCFIFLASEPRPALSSSTCVAPEDAHLGVCGSRQSGAFFKRGCGIRGGFGWRNLRTNQCDIDASNFESACGLPLDPAKCRRECRPDLPTCMPKQTEFVQPIQPLDVVLQPNVESCSRTIKLMGTDRKRRRAEFDVVLLNEGFSWVFGDVRNVERDRQSCDGQSIEQLLAQQLGAATDVIAVGAASAEGNAALENKRAYQRAETAMAWAKRAFAGNHFDGWIFQLGQFRHRCVNCDPELSAVQRPVVLIGVTAKDTGVVLQEALRSAFRYGEVLDLSDYRLSQLIPVE
jgi:hypothetical protein